MAEFDPTMKKKKAKNVVIAPEADAEPTTAATDDAPTDAAALTEMFGAKKKKAKKTATVVVDTKEDEVVVIAGKDLIDADGDWPDWTYDETLDRVFKIMLERNPSLATGEKVRFTLRPPQCLRVGTKKTAFANFVEICRLMKRQPKHVMAFLMAELGTSGSIDGTDHLIVKGRYKQAQFESVLRKYVKEYVTCHTCKSPDTNMLKDGRLFFLQCETCGSRCSVSAIKTGFTAVTTKRAALRAAAGN